MFGLAADVRRNAAAGALPAGWMGNAAAAVHARGGTPADAAAASLPLPPQPQPPQPPAAGPPPPQLSAAPPPPPIPLLATMPMWNGAADTEAAVAAALGSAPLTGAGGLTAGVASLLAEAAARVNATVAGFRKVRLPCRPAHAQRIPGDALVVLRRGQEIVCWGRQRASTRRWLWLPKSAPAC
ncbi:hypothetical protein FOA52_013618 [Chlamydomonas sp. UWO 241]|nr:hypothetical protein FOA52_013618 [Chlamydomonas sp. UWO 241]